MDIWKVAAVLSAMGVMDSIAEMSDPGAVPELAVASAPERLQQATLAPDLSSVPEIADLSLHDVAILRPDPQYGLVIVYNPAICQMVGPACGFFLSHEHGHVAHEHQPRQSADQLATMESQADCWAAAHSNPREVMAAFYLFMNGGSSPNWEIYGHPRQRAARVRECAINAGNWVGD